MALDTPSCARVWDRTSGDLLNLRTVRASFRFWLAIVIASLILVLFLLRGLSVARADANIFSEVTVSVEDANHAAIDGADVIAMLWTTVYAWGPNYDCNRVIVRKTGLNGAITLPAAVSERAAWNTLIDRMMGKRLELTWVIGAKKSGLFSDPPLTNVFLLADTRPRPVGVQTLVLRPTQERIDEAMLSYERLYVAADCKYQDISAQNFRDEVVDAMISLACSAVHETRVSPEATAAFYRTVRPKYGRPAPELLEAGFFRRRGDATTTGDLCLAAKGAPQ
jgi:hypothetical protein